MKQIKEQFINIIKDLIIDKGMNIFEIKELIKSSKITKIN